MSCDKTEYLWNIKIGETTHKISLIQKAVKSNYSLYVDDELLGNLKISRWFNYEYKFEIDGNPCSIVKLLTEDKIRIAVNSEYQDKDRKYAPVLRPCICSKIMIILNWLIFFGAVICGFVSHCDILDKLFFIVMCIGCVVFIDKISRYLVSSPTCTKSKLFNFRVIILIAIEAIYVICVIYLLKLFGSL